ERSPRRYYYEPGRQVFPAIYSAVPDTAHTRDCCDLLGILHLLCETSVEDCFRDEHGEREYSKRERRCCQAPSLRGSGLPPSRPLLHPRILSLLISQLAFRSFSSHSSRDSNFVSSFVICWEDYHHEKSRTRPARQNGSTPRFNHYNPNRQILLEVCDAIPYTSNRWNFTGVCCIFPVPFEAFDGSYWRRSNDKNLDMGVTTKTKGMVWYDSTVYLVNIFELQFVCIFGADFVCRGFTELRDTISEVLKMYDIGHVFGILAVERCVNFVLFCCLLGAGIWNLIR
ncbi:hypothetical protein BZA77DRAFT_365849, partial [Pyronema omphalodes]